MSTNPSTSNYWRYAIFATAGFHILCHHPKIANLPAVHNLKNAALAACGISTAALVYLHCINRSVEALAPSPPVAAVPPAHPYVPAELAPPPPAAQATAVPPVPSQVSEDQDAAYQYAKLLSLQTAYDPELEAAKIASLDILSKYDPDLQQAIKASLAGLDLDALEFKHD